MELRTIHAHLFLRDNCELGEGPLWMDDHIWWIDVNVGKLLCVDAKGEKRRTYEIGRRIGSAAPIDKERFIVAVEDGIGIFHCRDGTVEILASPEKDIAGNRFNDGKCDPNGRFVAGTLNMNGELGVCALYSIDHTKRVQKILSSVTLSNGLAWNASGTIMYFIDSLSYEVAAFEYDCQSGQLGKRSVVVRVPKEIGIPDGMAIDTEGNLWVAHWDGGAVRCWSSTTGECLAKIPIPCSRPTSCCFGGPNFEKLFITTAQGETSGDLDGSLFMCEPGVTGYPTKYFSL